jgi:hypothetical protein
MLKKIRMLAPSITLLFLSTVPLTSVADGSFQASDAIMFHTGVPIAGGVTLTRDDDSIRIRGALSGIKKKAVYSVWWIIFNNPAECLDGGPGVCGEKDVYPGGPADIGVRNASGFITGTDGTAYFVGELEAGPPPAGLAGFGQLNDAMGAEVHLVIQSHGGAVPGTVAFEMTHPTGTDLYGVIFAPPAP